MLRQSLIRGIKDFQVYKVQIHSGQNRKNETLFFRMKQKAHKIQVQVQVNRQLLHQAKFGINDASLQMRKIRQRTTVSALLFDFFEGKLLWLVVSFSARVRRYSVVEILQGWPKEQAARRLFRNRIPPIKSLAPEGKGKKP